MTSRQNYRLRLTIACRLFVAAVAATCVLSADTIPVGAPLDGKNHVIVIFEAADETVSSVEVDNTQLTKNRDGSFTLGIAIQPGNGTAQTDIDYNGFGLSEPGSDSIRLEKNKNGGVNLTRFTSETGDTDDLGPKTREQESITIGNGKGNETTFIISSPGEPSPEPNPARLIAVGAALAGACAWKLRRRSRPAHP